MWRLKESVSVQNQDWTESKVSFNEVTFEHVRMSDLSIQSQHYSI